MSAIINTAGSIRSNDAVATLSQLIAALKRIGVSLDKALASSATGARGL